MAVATNCWCIPIAKVKPTGVTAIEETMGAVTVSIVLCVTPARLAEIFAVPVCRELANPVALILAIEDVDELQATMLVRSALLPSL